MLDHLGTKLTRLLHSEAPADIERARPTWAGLSPHCWTDILRGSAATAIHVAELLDAVRPRYDSDLGARLA